MSELSYLTTDDMAALTGKTRDYWARLCHSKVLIGVKLGNDWHVPKDVFEAFMRGGSSATGRKRLSARQARRSA